MTTAGASFDVAHVDLYFLLDADIVILAVELYASDLPLDRVQDTLFRFGRAYPAYWDRDGLGGNCARRVEWLAADDRVLATSDYDLKREIPDALSRATVLPASPRTGSIC